MKICKTSDVCTWCVPSRVVGEEELSLDDSESILNGRETSFVSREPKADVESIFKLVTVSGMSLKASISWLSRRPTSHEARSWGSRLERAGANAEWKQVVQLSKKGESTREQRQQSWRQL